MSQPIATAIIADDEEPMRDMLRKRLQEAWPELDIVAEAANGIEAIALAGQHQPDIVFLDIRMPGLSGIEAARMLFNRCHIVFITAYDQYAIEAFEQGALDYLLKPVNLERLKTTCSRLQSRLGKTPNNIERQLSQLLQQSGQRRRGAAAGIPALDPGPGRQQPAHDLHQGSVVLPRR